MKTLFWIAVLSLPILPNLWCIWHARRHAFPGPNEQALWVRTGILVPVIGGLLYFFVGRGRARPLPLAEQTPPAAPHAGPSAGPPAAPPAVPSAVPPAVPLADDRGATR